MEVDRKYFTKHQIKVIESMDRDTWYSAYDLKSTFNSLRTLIRMDIVDIKEEVHDKFFSNNIHVFIKLKKDFRLTGFDGTKKVKGDKNFERIQQ